MYFYSCFLDYLDHFIQLYSFCPPLEPMAFKRSAVRSRLSPPEKFRKLRFSELFLYFPNFSHLFLIHQECIRKGNCTSKYTKLNSSGNTMNTKNTMNIMRHKVLDGKMSIHKNSQLSIMFF